MVKKAFQILAAFVFAVTVSLTVQAVGDQILSAGKIRLMNGGAVSWLERVNSAGQVQFWDNVNSRNVLVLDDNTGGVILSSAATTAQLVAMVPPAINIWKFNSQTQHLVYSTGTAAGNWSAYGCVTAACGLGSF